MTTRILILCGGGASSGFLAQSLRKAAKKAGTEVSVEARSESEVEEYLDRIDVVLIAPHLAYMSEEITTKARAQGVGVADLPAAVYGRLDGAGAFKIAQDLMAKEQQS